MLAAAAAFGAPNASRNPTSEYPAIAGSAGMRHRATSTGDSAEPPTIRKLSPTDRKPSTASLVAATPSQSKARASHTPRRSRPKVLELAFAGGDGCEPNPSVFSAYGGLVVFEGALRVTPAGQNSPAPGNSGPEEANWRRWS